MSRPTDVELRNLLGEADTNGELLPVDRVVELAYLNGVGDALAWVLGDADEPELPQPDWCTECSGRGGFARDYETPGGRVLDNDQECGRCEGSGIEP